MMVTKCVLQMMSCTCALRAAGTFKSCQKACAYRAGHDVCPMQVHAGTHACMTWLLHMQARLVVQVLATVVAQGLEPSQIGVICFYKAQVGWGGAGGVICFYKAQVGWSGAGGVICLFKAQVGWSGAGGVICFYKTQVGKDCTSAVICFYKAQVGWGCTSGVICFFKAQVG